MKHEPKVTANALAVVGGIWYVLCVFWVMVSKSSYMGIIGSWFHGVDFNALPTATLTTSSVLTGLVSFVAFAWISGYIFAVAYNKFLKK
ncbi:hypothetical protein A3G67_01025 [Candidatus Roizmanbacteria bacterium RIFCSPLOWO2_12_FULL_40_12]|uniref:Uncharacterized protein n=1 Tax=Candidatus Roizmanbacteria bacterium RIFCSPLOWO2_01_FULL_40_42 TaxID=1802066 RepID=A0A1F7J1Z8_9BACT|nr:MAG: hypothetical protein A2779_03660 [Candidatus Roizmanbacteria bacterium RIFCSPHIGHO2_01_FULL_40_98]OGK27678.1 MAG: hypothetical protein A3C31_04130 [Candidatus Roizmanbacteria bacterium RIFCSPHIGHO2_02_FULL_40_53]OGK29742.1 MAG: hypothetical protein A2W49_04770 [Candidatus Roizmanbacteria bacterium RIFCSPHIGHO2_12_41_18]OGK37355.1 MAG: hypothetical protein A3E69_04710 [Candidatus Roizmanbacteria bacterium RIFCSPHIGHO2_12_FULL_40_130]OGK49631.1 MAG: hypothetical protein A3B50_04235 [Candi